MCGVCESGWGSAHACEQINPLLRTGVDRGVHVGLNMGWDEGADRSVNRES